LEQKKKAFKGLFRKEILINKIGGRLVKQPHHDIEGVVE
jgi:hypothetical protein